MNHKNSLKLEKKLHNTVEEKMRQMQQQEFSWIETQYLKKAVDVLNECRRTLMYTYAFAFYLEKNNYSDVFETNQADLENSVEALSGLLEKDLDIEKEQVCVR
jgi:ariadne-1